METRQLVGLVTILIAVAGAVGILTDWIPNILVAILLTTTVLFGILTVAIKDKERW